MERQPWSTDSITLILVRCLTAGVGARSPARVAIDRTLREYETKLPHPPGKGVVKEPSSTGTLATADEQTLKTTFGTEPQSRETDLHAQEVGVQPHRTPVRQKSPTKEHSENSRQIPQRSRPATPSMAKARTKLINATRVEPQTR